MDDTVYPMAFDFLIPIVVPEGDFAVDFTVFVWGFGFGLAIFIIGFFDIYHSGSFCMNSMVSGSRLRKWPLTLSNKSE